MKVLGSKELAAKLKAYPDIVKRETESLLKQEARSVCVEMARMTSPGPGFGEPRKFRLQVEAQIRRVFASRDKPYQVAEMLKKIDPRLAQAYWFGGVKKNNAKVMKDIISKGGLAEGFDRAAHRAARTGKGASVPKEHVPVSLANSASLRKYVNEKIAQIGFAKAGWVAAGISLGGRIRSNNRGADGSRSTSEKIPAWLRKIANKHKDIGGSRMSTDGTIIRVEVFTNVRHAREALNEGFQEVAVQNAENNFIRALRHSLAAINRKLFKAA